MDQANNKNQMNNKNQTNYKEEDIKRKVEVIMRQTNYSETDALEKLNQFDYDEIKVIKDYFGISDKKQAQIKSVNQAIYKQLRGHLDSAMRDYHSRVERGEAKNML